MGQVSIEVSRLNRRFLSRIFRHHIVLLAFALSSVAILYVTRPYKDVLTRMSFATAYPAIVLLCITLLTGPLNILRGRGNPVSSDLRRDIGIWAGILSLLHAAVGQCVHLRGRPWLYYVYGPTEKHVGLRHDLFGFSNYTGAVATLVLIALFATSNDWSLRALGTPRWKSLQRWNYAVFLLAALHAFGYQGIEKQKMDWVGLMIVCVALTIAVQGAGFWKRGQTVQHASMDADAAGTTARTS